MFVCIEGIDGAGKTSVSETVNTLLWEKGIKSIKISKKDIHYKSSYLSLTMHSLKQILWDQIKNEPIYEVTNSGWLFLHAAWYTIMWNNMIQELLTQYEVVLIDGWCYKLMCRFLTKENFDKNIVYHVFDELMQGDLVFLLDVHPEICFSRKNSFTCSEMGLHEQMKGSKKERFINFQLLVREEYIKLAMSKKWKIINVDSLCVESTARIISEIINNSIVKLKANNNM